MVGALLVASLLHLAIHTVATPSALHAHDEYVPNIAALQFDLDDALVSQSIGRRDGAEEKGSRQSELRPGVAIRVCSAHSHAHASPYPLCLSSPSPSLPPSCPAMHRT